MESCLNLLRSVKFLQYTVNLYLKPQLNPKPHALCRQQKPDAPQEASQVLLTFRPKPYKPQAKTTGAPKSPETLKPYREPQKVGTWV